MWAGRLLAVLVCFTCILTIGFIMGHLFQEIDRWSAF
jgi:hypothetical protein